MRNTQLSDKMTGAKGGHKISRKGSKRERLEAVENGMNMCIENAHTDSNTDSDGEFRNRIVLADMNQQSVSRCALNILEIARRPLA